MSVRLTTLLEDLEAMSTADAERQAAAQQRCQWLAQADAEEMQELFAWLLGRPAPLDPRMDGLLRVVFHRLLAGQRGAATPAEVPPGQWFEQIARLYRHLGPASRARGYLPSLLSSQRSQAAWSRLVDLLVEDPPSDATSVAGIFSPLFRDPGLDPGWLFPRLWDALAHPATAGPVLDLANFLVRKGRVAAHPGRGRVQQLAELLAGVVGRLGRLEQHRPAALEEFQAQAGQVNDGVALAVSLCDALALIGDPSVAGKLYQALEVSHRRVRVEAAAALARLGERPGIEALVQLAAEPIVRLRVLAYADELGLEDQIDQTWRTSVARAEAELVLWLAQPAQIGIPPTRCELLDARTQYWPGFQEPVECFLFRFEYELGPTHFSNIALAGPATYAFAADLSDLSPDDIFAAFAGWYAEHDEIREIDADQLDSSQRIEVARLQRRLHDEGYGAIVPRKLGEFFGDPVLVATAIREGRPGIAVTDRLQSYWLPQSASRRPPGAEEAYCIYKGRRLLRTFNE